MLYKAQLLANQKFLKPRYIALAHKDPQNIVEELNPKKESK